MVSEALVHGNSVWLYLGRGEIEHHDREGMTEERGSLHGSQKEKERGEAGIRNGAQGHPL